MTSAGPIGPDTVDPVVASPDIVRSFASGSALVNDRPFRLAGGSAMEPAGLPSTLPLDWHGELMGLVAGTCRRGVKDGRRWLTFPPTAMISEPGIGRVHATRQIARHAGLPHFVWDVAGEGRPAGSHPSDRDVRMPSAPLLAMLASGCANPLISVVGAGKASEEALRMLAEMTDPKASRRWVDSGAGAAIDLSNVSWFLSWDLENVAPRWLEKRFERVVLGPPPKGRERLLVLSVLDEVLADTDAASAVDAAALARIMELAGKKLPLSEIYERVARVVVEAAVAPKSKRDA